MHKYDKVLSYIGYFYSDSNEIGKWVVNPSEFPYVVYSKEMRSFIKEVSQTDLLDQDYMAYLNENLPSGSYPGNQLEGADLRMLRAILTYFVRQERFQEGLWLTAAREGYFHKILVKIRKLVENED